MSRGLLAALIVMTAAAGCGDNAPGKKAFLAKADPICVTATEVAVTWASSTVFDEFRQFHSELAVGVEKTVTALERLELPSGGDGKAAKAWITALREATSASRDVVQAADRVDFGATEAAARKAAETYQRANAQARSYGAAECGRREADAVDRMVTVLPTTMRKGWLEKANFLCRVAFDELALIEQPDSREEARWMFEHSATRLQKLVTELRALIPAPADKAEFDGVTAAFDETAAALREGSAAIAAGGAANGAAIAARLQTTTTAAEARADSSGLFECGSEP